MAALCRIPACGWTLTRLAPLKQHAQQNVDLMKCPAGEVKITKQGQAEPLAFRRTGDYFGELSLRTGAPTNASVIATGQCTYKILSPDTKESPGVIRR